MRARLSRIDALLLGGLLPAFAVAFGMHVREVARSGLAQLPVYAVPSDADGYPRVAGYRVETDSRGSGLEPGDRLLRVGDADLRGAGYLAFDAIALARATPDRPAPLLFERGGERRLVELRPRPHALAWFRIPAIASFVLMCTLVLLRAPGARPAQIFFAAFVSYALVQAQFYGGPEWKTWASLLLWNFLGPVSAVLILLWAARFPDDVPESQRVWEGWPWLAGALYLVVRLDYLYGVPFPPAVVPRLAFASNAAFMLGTIAILALNYRHASPVGRRQIKWVIYGATIGAGPLSAVELAGALAPELTDFPRLFALAGVATTAGPVCILIAVVRHSAFDIDRLIGATASFSLAVAGMAGAVLVGMPAIGRRAASALDLPVAATQVVLALALLAVAFPLSRRLRPQIDRLFFPERRAIELGTAQLLADLSDCASPEQVLELIRDRVAALLRPSRCTLYARDGKAFAARPADPLAPRLDASGALVSDLALRPVPRPVAALRVESDSESAAADAALLEALGDGLLLPLRQGRELAAFLALGPKRSGDVYTGTELSLLAAIAEKASAELRRMHDHALLENERARRREVEALREAAEQAQRARTRLLAAASHDLRQPLHAIGLFAEALGQRIHEPSARELLDRIERSTEALAEMFGALLDLSRLEAGALHVEVRDVVLGPILERVAVELAPLAARKGLELRCVRTGAAVRSDPLLLGRIVLNLASNAVRHTERGRVLLGVRRAGARLRVEVWDTGPGIPPERRDEIFQEFVRLGSGGDGHGLGLGLAIVKGLAERLGHELSLRSEPGRGSRFAVAAPRVRAPVAEPAAAAPAALDLRGLRVLVVDDDPAALESLAAVLEGWGCQVRRARTPLEALARAGAGAKPDAIVCDLQLGDAADGLQVLDAVRDAAGGAIPALVVSGSTSGPARQAVRDRGLAFLAKPVSPARLRAALWNLTR